MNNKRFKALKVGDQVILAKDCKVYIDCNPLLYRRKGETGIVGDTNIPSVRGKNGKARFFVCVDFPPMERPDHPQEWIRSNKHGNVERVGAFKDDLV